jgi:hypothetical protein
VNVSADRLELAAAAMQPLWHAYREWQLVRWRRIFPRLREGDWIDEIDGDFVDAILGRRWYHYALALDAGEPLKPFVIPPEPIVDGESVPNRPHTDGRDALIFARLEAGDLPEWIGRDFGISAARVRQLARRERERRERIRRGLWKLEPERVEVYVPKQEMLAAWKRRRVEGGYYHDFWASYFARYRR